MVETTNKKYMKTVLYNGSNNVTYSNNVKEIPVPGNGEVLIRVKCAVINPSDTYLMKGYYSGTYEYPFVPGNEGSGMVIESGGGFMAW